MLIRRSQLCLLLALGLTVTTAGACAQGTVSGGGWMVSTNGVSKANFGFNATRCGELLEGNLNFHDRHAVGFSSVGGVRLNGPLGEVVRLCQPTAIDPVCEVCPTSTSSGVLVRFEYRSTNPRVPGTGTVLACLIDHQGDDIPDEAGFLVETGPYTAYSNSGPLQGGSIERAPCPE